MVCSDIVAFSHVKQHEKLPPGPGGSRGIQFQKKNGRLVLLVGNRCKYTDVIEDPSTRIYVSGERTGKSRPPFSGGNRSLQLSNERNIPITEWHKLGVNQWRHVGTFRLEQSTVRTDLGTEPMCWFTLGNVFGGFIGRARAARRLLAVSKPPARRSARLEEISYGKAHK